MAVLSFRQLTLRDVVGAVLVAIGFLTLWALIPDDPDCSEPPCGDD